MSLPGVLRRLCADLSACDARAALVGGLAVSARTVPRFTRDVDLAVAVRTDAEAEALVRALRARGWSLRAIVEQEAIGRLATARIEHPSSPGVVADLLFATTGIQVENVADALPLEVLGTRLAVAAASDLAAMKVLSAEAGRPDDRADLHRLWASLDDADRHAVHRRLALLEARGRARGQDLRAKCDALTAELT
jgi:hypothetical protein